MVRLNCILLIDDDEPTNYLNKKLIREAGCADYVVTKESGEEGLDYLVSCAEGAGTLPELIFLDINMPAMNGWEFLDEYRKLDESIQSEVLLVMLSTSLNPDDRKRAESMEEVAGFINKPFNMVTLDEVLEDYFKN